MSRRQGECKVCGKVYVVGSWITEESSQVICNKCDTQEWIKEMKAKGCSVGDYKKIGDIPDLVKKKVSDMPKIVCDTVTYRDITDLFYYDTKYKKEYLTKEKMDEIELKRYRAAEHMRNKKDAEYRMRGMKQGTIEYEHKRLIAEGKTEAEMVESLINSGFKRGPIIERLGINIYYYTKHTKELRAGGKIPNFSGSRYTELDNSDILDMRDQGFKVREIAEKYNVEPRTMREKITRLEKVRGLYV